MELKFKKCNLCGNVVWSFNDKNISCCNESMRDIIPNSEDASFEKHVPNYEINNDKIMVSVNHVMEENHYIMWVMVVNDNEIQYKEFKYSDKIEAEFVYKGKGTIYSYCNKHSLWSKTIE